MRRKLRYPGERSSRRVYGSRPEIDQAAAVDHSLEAGVVDRQHRPRALEQAVPFEESLAVDRRQRGVPVVAVEDVRGPAHPLRAFEGRHGEQGEAQRVVAVAVIDPAAAEERGAVDEVDADVAVRQQRGPRGVGEAVRDRAAPARRG